MTRNFLNLSFFNFFKNNFFYFLPLISLIFVFFIVFIKQNVINDRASILVEMSTSAIVQSNLWVNDQSKRPITNNLSSIKKNTYIFHGIDQDINYLRFDPIPGVGNTSIKIFKISIRSPVGHDFIILPADISKWQILDGKITNLNNEYIELLSSKNIILVSNLPYKVHLNFPSLIHKFNKYVNELRYIYLLFYISFFVSVLYCFKNQPKSFLWVLGLIPLVFIASSHFIAGSSLGQIQVDKAVGIVAYSGKSLIPNSLFLYSTILFVIIIAFLFACLDKKRIKAIKAEQTSIALTFLDFFPYILIFIYLFPDLSNDYPRHVITWNGMLVPNFDSDNAMTWAYMIKKGLVPFKDFWYPYGFSYIFDFPFPLGKFLFASVSFIYFSLFIFYLKATTKISSFSTIFITLVLLIGNIPNNNELIYPQPERHLLAFVLIFSYIYLRNKNSLKPLIFFWLLLCLTFLIEPSQVIYAALGLGLIFGVDLLNTHKVNLKIVFIKFIREFFVGLLFVVAIVSILKLKGFFPNVSDFYLEMDTVASYMAFPTNLTFNLKSLITLNFFLVFTPFLLLGIGIYKAIKNPNWSNNLALVLLSCGAIGVMQIQKHSIRPIDWALFYSASLGIFIFLLLLLNEYKLKINAYIKYNIFLLFFLYLYTNGSLMNFTARIFQFDDKIKYTMNSFKLLNEKSYGALNIFPPNLNAYKDEKILIETLHNKYKNPTFYSLPDNPILYLIADNNPPYQINGFSLSPIFEQKKIINDLKKNQVQFIIIEPNKNYIDGFSYTVRLPLIYKYVTQNYTFDFETSRFMVFRLKKSSEDINFNGWSKALSDSIDFGHLLSSSNYKEKTNVTCIQNCKDFLKITLDDHNLDRISFDLRLNSQNFKISFNCVYGQKDYLINLDNLWFYSKNAELAFEKNERIKKIEVLQLNRRKKDELY
jgi:hypothetical protein